MRHGSEEMRKCNSFRQVSFPYETESNKEVRSLPFQSVELLETDAASTAARRLAIRLLFPPGKLATMIRLGQRHTLDGKEIRWS